MTSYAELRSQLRSYTKAQPVALDEVPPWLVDILKAFVELGGWDLDWEGDTQLLEEVLDEICPGTDWFINWGTSGGNLVAEPFDFDAKAAADLNNLCSLLGGINWKVGSDVWRDPGHGIRITLRPNS